MVFPEPIFVLLKKCPKYNNNKNESTHKQNQQPLSTNSESRKMVVSTENDHNMIDSQVREDITPDAKKIPNLSLPTLDEVIREESLNEMELITRKAIALHLKSLNINFSTTALEDLFDLFSNHIHGLMQNLQRITQTQRRFKASPTDLKLLLKELGITTLELENELIKTKRSSQEIISQKKELEKLSDEVLQGARGNTTNPHDSSYAFFSHDNDDVIELLPPTHKRGNSFLPWLPQFPPDHTYLRTPKYTDRITDQKVVRTKIAEESRLGEKALDHLISYKVRIEKDDFEKVDDVNGDQGHIEESDGKLDAENKEHRNNDDNDNFNIWVSGSEKKLDVVKYAKARLKYLEKKAEKKKNKNKNTNLEYLSLITNLSSYDTETPEFVNTSSETVNKQYNSVLRSLVSLKKKKTEREKERKILLEEAKKKREESKQKDSFDDFGSFGKDDGFANFDNFGDENRVSDFNFMIDGDEHIKDDDGDIDLGGFGDFETATTTAAATPGITKEAEELDKVPVSVPSHDEAAAEINDIAIEDSNEVVVPTSDLTEFPDSLDLPEEARPQEPELGPTFQGEPQDGATVVEEEGEDEEDEDEDDDDALFDDVPLE